MDLNKIKGLGEKRIKKLNDAGIYRPEDLILHFPYKYLDLSQETDFNLVQDGETAAFSGEVSGKAIVKFVRKGLNYVKVSFITANGTNLTCTWFNQPYIARQMIEGRKFYCFGKVKKFRKNIDVSAPVIISASENNQKIITLYKKINGVPSNILTEAIKQILKNIKISGFIDEGIASKFSLMPLDNAIRNLHFPDNLKIANLSAESVATENLCYSICVYNILKQRNTGYRKFKYSGDTQKTQEFIKSLPYELTLDQKKAVSDIFRSLSGETQMNRLIVGDVGSGKTIVAFIVMYYAYLNGYQSVMMAPTEILASQHYKNAVNIFSKFNLNIEYLSGSQSKSVRDTSLFNIKNGIADIIIGTHSVISESVIFSNLSLVITDEQHRFGVTQRGALENKSAGADTLVMSATPIPRTLALTLYGDLEQSIIKTMPKNKASIATKAVPPEKITDMYDYILKSCKEGYSTYIVCPRIESEEDGLISSVELYNELLPKFKNVGIGLLHGQIKDFEKNEIMRRFQDGEIKVLVSTTVVEVGIDVKNAVNIIIYNAERYGLSQLHQLRGRVGRGEKDSYCFLLTDNLSESSKKRLDYFLSCDNGFELSEYDFEQRGAGDFLGTRQHGQDSGIVKITPQLLKKAKEIADYIIDVPSIYEAISKSIEENGQEYIKSLTLN